MPKKSNIDFSTTVPATYRSQTVTNGIPGPWSSTPVTGCRLEVRKLIRDPTSPTEKREKPYHNKKVTIQYPDGQWIWNINLAGTTYTKSIGCPGTTGFNQGLSSFYMYYYSHGKLIYAPRTIDWPLNPDLLSQAEVKCYAALRNKYKELDSASYLSFGLWFGERAETASLLRDCAVTFSKFIVSVRSMNARNVSRAIMDLRADLKPGAVYRRVKREIALMRNRLLKKQKGEVILRNLPKETLFTANRLVLAYNLGAAPLLRDLDSVYKAMLQTVADPTALMIKAKAWVIRQDIGTNVVKSTRGHVVEKTRVNSLVRYTVTMVCQPALTERAILERAGLANAPSLLAELTSCSFIINYFYPILDYLKATSTPLAFEWCDGSYSVKVSHLQETEIRSTSRAGPMLAKGFYRHMEHRRKVYTTFPVPIPPLSFRGQDLTVDQAVNVTTVALEKARKALRL
ncbi:maturation protein [ssRNA phage SRR5466725_12]|uniref:Maturation protein n=1 Tax=ssRNA phage SRR5466725_12 TaxID=2786410 RepID=A0A8S5KZK1_9VIRU|nr:maturation protein [ssRNA phage SRR5466725_12]DAD50825.1 TPA_asm: maturation protein [ssRNA phage SRR5466725_12]